MGAALLVGGQEAPGGGEGIPKLPKLAESRQHALY